MGQQQLLLLVLAAIIVGAGVILGVNMFQENAAQANMDAVAQDVMTIAGKAQAWYRRPLAAGGGGQDFNANTITLVKLGYPADPYINDNGSYAFGTLTQNTCILVGTGKENLDATAGNLTVTATITGTAVTVAYTK